MSDSELPPQKYREIAFRHHGEECAKCGSTENLHVHHKDGDRSNNDPENLEVLCKEHHWDEHRDQVAARASGPRDGWGPTKTNEDIDV